MRKVLTKRTFEDDLAEVKDLVSGRRWSKLKDFLTARPVADIADLLSGLEKPERVIVFRCLPRTLGAEVFAYLEPDDQNELLRELTDEESRSLVRNLAPDDRTALLSELPAEVTQKLLTLLDPEELNEARQLLGYPEESVGRLMTPDYVAVHPEWTVSQAMEEIRRTARSRETINVLYVIDLASRLIGVVSLRRIVLGKPEDKVRGLMRSPAISISAFEDRENAAKLMERYDLLALPVVDSQGVLLGIVTADDVLEVAREETTEDFHKGAGVSPLRVSLKEATVRLLYKNRVVWLLGLAAVYLLSGNIMSLFEETIARTVSLVFFLPVLIDSAGNAGAQSATLMVRALATGDVRVKDWARVVLREVLLALTLGATMGILVWTVAAFRVDARVGLVAGVSMILVVLLSCVIGVGIPFLLGRLGWDPAAASSPLVTSVADILGVLVYFSVARLWLGI